MLNLRQFSRPNPCDSNLNQRGEPLGMPNHGNFPFYHNTHAHLRPYDSHNYVQSSGGYMSASKSPMTSGGITILKEPRAPPKSSNPLFNALVNPPHYPRISQLVDSRLTLPNPLIQPPTSPI